MINAVVTSEYFGGPLPHPRHLEQYERICPGLAERLVKMAETAQGRAEDRHDNIIEKEYADRRFGMWLGFAALAIVMVTGTISSIFVNAWLGGAIFTVAAIGAVVNPFVNGRANRQSRAATQVKSENQSVRH